MTTQSNSAPSYELLANSKYSQLWMKQIAKITYYIRSTAIRPTTL